MRILHVTHQYPPAIGGAEKYIADLSVELASRGHQVDVFTSQAVDYHTWRNELPAFEQQEGVQIHRYRSLQRRAYVWKLLQFGLGHYWPEKAVRYEPFIFLGGGPLSLSLGWAMLRQGRNYDLVHLNCLVYSHAAYGYWIAKRLGLPIIVTPLAHAEQAVTYDIGYQRRVLAGADHIFAVTPTERDMLIALGLNKDKISTSGVGLRLADYQVDFDQAQARQRLGLPADGFVVLFLGRKTEYKGLDLILDAYRTLKPEIDIHLLAAGPDTDYSQKLRAQVKDEAGITWLSSVSDEEKLLALQACDCLALPSVGESFGIVYLEAWLMGKPVIGARTVSVSAVIDHGQNGWLISPGDGADLADRIRWLAANPGQAQAMGEQGKAKVHQEYTTTRITDRVEQVYQRLVRQI